MGDPKIFYPITYGISSARKTKRIVFRMWRTNSILANLPLLRASSAYKFQLVGTEKRKYYEGSENTPYINEGKGDTLQLAQRAVSLPHRRIRGNSPLRS
eukprot:1146818-Pelagomonas_calceolata.AAC.1